ERFVDRYPELAKRHQPMVPIYERMRFLRSVPLFRDLSGDDVLRLAEKVEQVEHQKGDVVFAKGDPGEEMFLVVRGRVAVVDGGVTLAEMGEAEFFGELALLDYQPRSADAVCQEDAQLLRLRGADLEELMTRRPGAMREIVRVLAHRLRKSGRRAGQ
ncbi:MAG: cyclic nucleotide-binding domain-containing protein, partial [Myxococcota bacterium]